MFEENASNDKEDRARKMFPKMTTNEETPKELPKKIENAAYEAVNKDLNQWALGLSNDDLIIGKNVSFIEFNVTLYSKHMKSVRLPAAIFSQNPISFSNLKEIQIGFSKQDSLEKISYVLQGPDFQQVEEIEITGNRRPIPVTKSLGKLAERKESKTFPRISLEFPNYDPYERDPEHQSLYDVNGGCLWDGFVHPKDCAALTGSPKSPKKPFTVLQNRGNSQIPYNVYVRNNQDVYAVLNSTGEEAFYNQTLPELLEQKRPGQNQIKTMAEEVPGNQIVNQINHNVEVPENQMMRQRNNDVMEE